MAADAGCNNIYWFILVVSKCLVALWMPCDVITRIKLNKLLESAHAHAFLLSPTILFSIRS